MGATEVLSTATPLLKATPSFADVFTDIVIVTWSELTETTPVPLTEIVWETGWTCLIVQAENAEIKKADKKISIVFENEKFFI